MRFIAQDPDIETIARRIAENDYDLQPDFQRGEVWTLQKKRRLVDTLLRGWHVPPVHLVSREDGRSDVLDGQQRLTAIRDFVRGHFSVDGSIEPQDPSIEALHGKRYSELPEAIARAFRKTTIRVFELVDYSPEEPHELFFRLNQPTSLTEAEKRNAFIGTPRNQVRSLVEWAVGVGYLGESIGFSNARMAYDDVLARALVSIESGTLEEKVTASRVTQRYRHDNPFSARNIQQLKGAMESVLGAFNSPPGPNEALRPNKATIHTWLCVGAQLESSGDLLAASGTLTKAIHNLETSRWKRSTAPRIPKSRLIPIFQDRSTARVADVSSVIIRDIIAWMMLCDEGSVIRGRNPKYHLASEAWSIVDSFSESESLEQILLSFADNTGWGGIGWA